MLGNALNFWSQEVLGRVWELFAAVVLNSFGQFGREAAYVEKNIPATNEKVPPQGFWS